MSRCQPPLLSSLFFFNDTATTEIYTLSLHDALPISAALRRRPRRRVLAALRAGALAAAIDPDRDHVHAQFPLEAARDRKHTSELQSQSNLVCRLLLEKKKSTLLPPKSSDSDCRHSSH